MFQALGLGSNRSQLPAGRAPVCPSRSNQQVAHKTRGSSSPLWPTKNKCEEQDSHFDCLKWFREYNILNKQIVVVVVVEMKNTF